jgi:hypothetical protein
MFAFAAAETRRELAWRDARIQQLEQFLRDLQQRQAGDCLWCRGLDAHAVGCRYVEVLQDGPTVPDV